MDKQLERDTHKKMLGGVCSGIGEYFGVDPNLVRLGAAALTVATAGMAVPALYGVGWALMPEKGTGRSIFKEAVAQAEHKAQEASADLKQKADEMNRPTAAPTDPVAPTSDPTEPIKLHEEPAPWEQPYDPSKIVDPRDRDGLNLS